MVQVNGTKKRHDNNGGTFAAASAEYKWGSRGTGIGERCGSLRGMRRDCGCEAPPRHRDRRQRSSLAATRMRLIPHGPSAFDCMRPIGRSMRQPCRDTVSQLVGEPLKLWLSSSPKAAHGQARCSAAPRSWYCCASQRVPSLHAERGHPGDAAHPGPPALPLFPPPSNATACPNVVICSFTASYALHCMYLM